ncbi:MAG: hypothetical protein KZQ82_00530 [Candidatus Thiodiazotropha sp. (ex Lucinoma annulata)]|nr:hypothetical protein [Candidatus Thiodiazotropha sp. (ex Lucinoma borealis)]MCU7839987.1 hypothetical protein [Candidatus Thiodiazotropha sp. (ex Troendleina suluensis)]MCU7855600.1 hypothetical protein [Candidatus Thiodiazotropha sp. (ex Lucinoma borealis)]MCU7871690.1 hypothetical protein [Candidatus Thiodiazotropha sp. (ex Lucinoma borealis)]MCU7882666.1 hypothetical protein [Candidatus Thiodiazotropha sp. (ex Lucinoma annulata)]
MYRLSEKLLAILLALLLGLIPLQSVMAGFSASSEQEGWMHQMIGMHSDGTVTNSDHDHAQCSVDTDCSDHDCSSCQCISSTLAILPVFLNLTNASVTPGYVRSDQGVINHASSSPFRPPRP